MKSVLLVVSIPLLRRGIRTALENTAEWSVLEATGPEVMELAQTHHPTCAILDGSLPTSFETCWALRQQVAEIGILILESSPDEERFFEFLMRGASAYETHSISADTLVDRVRRVCNGEYVITSEALLLPQPQVRLSRTTNTHEKVDRLQTPTPAFPLSPRELEMLEHIARGNSNKEIAKSLKISDQTVKNHITSILKKLSVDDRTAAVVHAIRRGWIELEPSIR